jgi:spore germination cell wall hydrolase CwlJ-like protein
MKFIYSIICSCLILALYISFKEHPTNYNEDDKILLSLIVEQNTPNPADIDCHSINIYYEARGENYEGRHKVFKVVENRTKQRNKTVCEVVWEPYQFSWTINYNSKKINNKQYEKIRKEVVFWMYNYDGNPKDITHYHHKNINPYWNKNMNLVATIGNHVFWR